MQNNPTPATNGTHKQQGVRPPKDVHASVRIEFDGLFTVDVRDDDASAAELADLAKGMAEFARRQRESMCEAETGAGYQ